jgi:two-component system, sensor histidine kinase
MLRLRDLSIRTKLILLTTACASLALLLSTAAFVLYNVRTFRASKVDELQSQARMLAFNSTAVLTFRDEAAAEQLLSSLHLNASVELAALYDNTGQCLARFGRQEGVRQQLPRLHDTSGYEFTTRGFLDLYEPVIDDGNLVGTLFLRSNMADLRQKISDYSRIVVVVLLCALATAVTLALILQRTISQPLVNLAETAGQITADDDYSIRVTSPSNDEIGLLYHSFNQMMDQVQKSRQALKGAVANMSHEIRTPINAILGFTELLLKGADEGDAQNRQEYLQTIASSGKHLLDLINDVLDFSRMEAGQMELELGRCSPHQVIAEVASVLRVRAQEKRLSLDYEWETPIPETILTDEGRLRQMLINLVGNAIKFTQSGGVHIVARIEAGRKPGSVHPMLAIDVIDSGIGIPQNKLDSVFQPFMQADNTVTRRFGGSGLGLAISRQIANALGGNLRVESEVGRGSRFTVTVDAGPLDNVRMLDKPQADLTNLRPHTGPTTTTALPGCRVLVVEDGNTNRKLIRLILARAGAIVSLAENGKIGLDLALKNDYDVILMDMQMPVMDGYTATLKLRDLGVTTPIIALTAHAMKGDETKCREAGCTMYLTKPVDGDRLLQTVSEAIGEPGQASPVNVPLLARTLIDNPVVSTLPADDEEFCEIVREFVERAHDQAQELRRAWDQRNYAKIADLGHWFKGAGGTAGFAAFTEPARKLEQFAQSHNPDSLERALQDVTSLVERLQAPPPHSEVSAQAVQPGS